MRACTKEVAQYVTLLTAVSPFEIKEKLRHLDKTQLSSNKWVNLITIEGAIQLVQHYDEEVVKTLAVTNDDPKIKFDDTWMTQLIFL